jgi:hypothetical protein
VAAVKVPAGGASGLVDSRLCPALAKPATTWPRQHAITAATTAPADHSDVHDPATFSTALAGGETAATSCTPRAARTSTAGRPDSHQLPRTARLDADDLPAYLRSRREAEKLLRCRVLPVTVLRAGIIVGHGGISSELTRQAVEQLPVMVTPKWVSTRARPIAVGDAVGLVGFGPAFQRT